MKETQYYYTVGLSLNGSWPQHSYSYSHSDKLSVGSVVVVPFGSSEKIGVVSSTVPKPEFNTKKINRVTGFSLPKPALELMHWLNTYYPGNPGIHTQAFLPSFLKNTSSEAPDASTGTLTQKSNTLKKLPKLTDSQKNAASSLLDNETSRYVLHGITGSGKTRLYIEHITSVLKKNKDVLLLYPEISLTKQLQSVLETYFDQENVHVYHSKLTKKKQRETWLKAHNTLGGNIFIGPRSALYLPYKELGLVIVDEAHDGAYKQDSGTRYSGIIVASALANQHKAQFVIGSATPPLQETQQLLSKGARLICVHKLASQANTEKTSFQIVDMSQKQQRSSHHLFSKKLISAIQNSLKNGKQTLLFLNKRGTARLLICEECGWHASCPRCDMPLTYHHDTFKQQCHVCGFAQKMSTSCPDCSSSITQKNLGIKAIEEDIMKMFPEAHIARFDSDNKKRDSFSERFEDIRSGKFNIIVGTQLITKGLDLPLLETVGVLQADSALLLPDYSSVERAFQQLTQVSGRVGRGHTKGHVILQTYQPENPLFGYVETQDWHTFYDEELRVRQSLHYPPFQYIAKVWIVKKSSAGAEKTIRQIKQHIPSSLNITITGPAPSFYEKSFGMYSWQIVLQSHSRKNLVQAVSLLPKDARYDLDPVSLL